VDTVEWGTAEPDRRRLPDLRSSIPRVTGLALAVAGFAALLAAEVLPWATVHVPASTAVSARPDPLPFTDGQELTLDRLQNGDILAFHLAALVLLGVIGFGLAGSAVRRRPVMGAALGLAGGLGITIQSLFHAVGHYFDSYLSYYAYVGLSSGGRPTVTVGAGGFLAIVGAVLLAACAVISGLWRRRPVGRPEPAAADPGEERQLTVSSLEPLDEAYFARPDTR
jgi:hypothetical protein